MLNTELLIVIIQIVAVILGAVAALLSLGISFWGWEKIFPFYKNSIKALERIYNVNSTMKVTDENGEKAEVACSILKENEKGFNIVKEAVLKNRHELPENLIEIGILKSGQATHIKWGTGDIVHGTLAYAKTKENIYPFLESPNSNRLLDSWVKEIVQRKLASISSAIILLWTIFAILLVYSSV